MQDEDALTDAADVTPEVRIAAVVSNGRWVLGEEQPSPGPGKVSLRLADGSPRTFPTFYANYGWVQPGSLLYTVATAPEEVRQQFLESPADIVVQLLQESRRAMTQGDIEAQLRYLLLEPAEGWWPAVRKELKAHPHVSGTGARLTWSEVAIDKTPSPRKPSKRVAKGSLSATGSRAVIAPVEATPSVSATAQVSDAAIDDRADQTGHIAEPPATESGPAQEAAANEAPAVVLTRPIAGPDGVDRVDAEATSQPLLADVVASPAAPTSEGRLAVAPPTSNESAPPVDPAGRVRGELDTRPRRESADPVIRLDNYAQLVTAIATSSPADADSLLVNSPCGVVGFLAAWTDSVEHLVSLDRRLEGRVELLLQRVFSSLVQPRHSADLAGAALLLVAQVNAKLATGAGRGLVLAGRQLLAECLTHDRIVQVLSIADRALLVQLVTGAFAGGVDDFTPERVALLLTLDQASRGDVLAETAAWTGLSLAALVRHPELAPLVAGPQRFGKVAEPVLRRALESGSLYDLVRLLTLPDSLLERLPLPRLAATLEQLATSKIVVGRLLQRFREQSPSDEESLVEQLQQAAQIHEAEVERLRGALAAEQRTRAVTAERLSALLEEGQAADDANLRQARLESSRLVVELLEEVRLGALSAARSDAAELHARLVALAAAEGIKAQGSADDVVSYDPRLYRVLGKSELCDAGASVVVVRPAYILSEADDRTVLRYGEVRAAND